MPHRHHVMPIPPDALILFSLIRHHTVTRHPPLTPTTPYRRQYGPTSPFLHAAVAPPDPWPNRWHSALCTVHQYSPPPTITHTIVVLRPYGVSLESGRPNTWSNDVNCGDGCFFFVKQSTSLLKYPQNGLDVHVEAIHPVGHLQATGGSTSLKVKDFELDCSCCLCRWECL